MGGTCTFVWLAFYCSRLLGGQGSAHRGALKVDYEMILLSFVLSLLQQIFLSPLRLQLSKPCQHKQNSNALPARLTSNKTRSIFNLHLCRGARYKHLFSCHNTRHSFLIASGRGMTGSADDGSTVDAIYLDSARFSTSF